MKKVLSLLVAFAFLQTQTWALSGGPVFTTGGLGATQIGTYAGVWLPSVTTRLFTNPATEVSPNSDANTLGIFVLGIPDVGVASGNYLFFQDGEAFFGSIQATVDPEDQSIKGLISGAAATNNLSNGVEFLSPVSAVGKMEASLDRGSSFGALLRINGEAFIQLQGFVPDVSPDGVGFATIREITFEVDGFKQSDTFSVPTIAAPNTVSVQPTTTTTSP